MPVEPLRGSTLYYVAYGVVKRGYPMLPFTDDPPEVLELMKPVRIIPSHDMALFAPRITILGTINRIITYSTERQRELRTAGGIVL